MNDMAKLTPEEEEAWKMHERTVANRQASLGRPNQDEVESLLTRIRTGMTTDYDAELVRCWIKAVDKEKGRRV